MQRAAGMILRVRGTGPDMRDDLAIRLLRRGYEALRPAEPGWAADAWAVRLLGRPALVLRGEAGARLFYDTDRVRRRGAVPVPLAALLFGRGAVHGLDGEAHAARKRMFLDVVDEPSVDRLATLVHEGLASRAAVWPRQPRVVVFDELVQVYGEAVLRWADVAPGHPAAVEAISRDLAAIVDGFGGRLPAYPRAWRARARCERWARELLRRARAGDRAVRPASPLAVLAGSDLDERTAAVELLNVLRPTVAVAWFGTFAALALDQHPQWRDRLVADPAAREAFAHEVRRRYPFVPALAGRARRPFEWAGHRLRPGERLVLDVYGTDNDERAFTDPERFDPERFLRGMPGEYAFLPQGGGHPETGHRCPGERITMRLLDMTLLVLAGTDYVVRSGKRWPERRIPTRPESGLVVRVRPPDR